MIFINLNAALELPHRIGPLEKPRVRKNDSIRPLEQPRHSRCPALFPDGERAEQQKIGH